MTDVDAALSQLPASYRRDLGDFDDAERVHAFHRKCAELVADTAIGKLPDDAAASALAEHLLRGGACTSPVHGDSTRTDWALSHTRTNGGMLWAKEWETGIWRTMTSGGDALRFINPELIACLRPGRRIQWAPWTPDCVFHPVYGAGRADAADTVLDDDFFWSASEAELHGPLRVVPS